MKRIYLLKYETPKFLVLSDYIDYKLHLEIVWFWGLFKTHKISECRVYDHENSKIYFEYWDRLINNKQPISV